MFNFKIYNWMSKSLNLKKFTLLIYAYVYSFTNHEGGFFECTIETISKNLGISRNSVGTALKYLSDNNFLIKTTYTYKNLKPITAAVWNLKDLKKCAELIYKIKSVQ